MLLFSALWHCCHLPAQTNQGSKSSRVWINGSKQTWTHPHTRWRISKSGRSNVHGRVTPSIEAMFQHQAKGSHFLGIGEPGAALHPGWIGRALPTYHQKHRTTRLVEGFIYKVPLREKRESYSEWKHLQTGGHQGGSGLHQYVCSLDPRRLTFWHMDRCIQLSNCTGWDHILSKCIMLYLKLSPGESKD